VSKWNDVVIGLYFTDADSRLATQFELEHGPLHVRTSCSEIEITFYHRSAIIIVSTKPIELNIKNILSYAIQNNKKIYINNNIYTVAHHKTHISGLLHIRLYPARLEKLKMQIWKFVNSAKKTYTSIFKT